MVFPLPRVIYLSQLPKFFLRLKSRLSMYHFSRSLAFQLDHTLLTTSSSEVLQHLIQTAVIPLTSLYLVTTNFHVCIPPLETKHLEVMPILGMSAFPKEEGLECIAMLLHHFLSNAGCKGSIKLLSCQNHVSEVICNSCNKITAAATYRIPCLCQILKQGLGMHHLILSSQPFWM